MMYWNLLSFRWCRSLLKCTYNWLIIMRNLYLCSLRDATSKTTRLRDVDADMLMTNTRKTRFYDLRFTWCPTVPFGVHLYTIYTHISFHHSHWMDANLISFQVDWIYFPHWEDGHRFISLISTRVSWLMR